MSQNQDCICQIPMWCMYERHWTKFNPLSKLPELGTQVCSCIKTILRNLRSLRNCEDFICKTCSTTGGAVNPFQTFQTINRYEFEIVSEFCYLGDVIGQACGCTDAVTARIGSTWKAFHNFLPILTNKGISLVNHGKVIQKCSSVWK